jgi:hypothetical protein
MIAVVSWMVGYDVSVSVMEANKQDENGRKMNGHAHAIGLGLSGAFIRDPHAGLEMFYDKLPVPWSSR